MPDDPAIPTKHGTVTLKQLAEMQPGMARLMVEYAQRFWTMYYAARAGNWPLARYMHAEMTKLGAIVPVVRPKYAAGMEEFEARCMAPLAAAITAKDWSAFDAAYRAARQGSDEFHDRFGKTFIRFRLPSESPPFFDLESGGPRTS